MPAGGAAEQLWRDAAGRVLQHWAAFDRPTSGVLGRKPRVVGDDAYASSHRAVTAAVERLDRALGREPAIEVPHRSLGLSL